MTLGGLQVFDAKLLEHLAAETGEPVSLGAFKGGLSIMFATAGFLGMLAGWLCDRIGAKKLILVGLALLAIGYFQYGSVNSLMDIYVIFASSTEFLCLEYTYINTFLNDSKRSNKHIDTIYISQMRFECHDRSESNTDEQI